MQNYFVKISYMHPYPINKELTVASSNFSAAVSKALKLWRKEAKGLKVKEISIKAIRL